VHGDGVLKDFHLLAAAGNVRDKPFFNRAGEGLF
jgi:hypothetical protein